MPDIQLDEAIVPSRRFHRAVKWCHTRGGFWLANGDDGSREDAIENERLT